MLSGMQKNESSKTDIDAMWSQAYGLAVTGEYSSVSEVMAAMLDEFPTCYVAMAKGGGDMNYLRETVYKARQRR